MKQNLSFLTVLTMVIVLLATPLSLSSAIALEATTTVPYTTTTTTWVWDCVSTTYPTTTTSTTLNLTGPDGINPDYTTVTSTTATTDADTEPTHPVTLDLLSSAEFTEIGNISILANPNYGGEWLSADCYTYDGASVSIRPTNGGPWDIATLRYLHITVTANVPFTVRATDVKTNVDDAFEGWLAEAFGVEPVDGWLPKGKYVGVIDLFHSYSDLTGETPNPVHFTEFEVVLSKPGSVTVGHIALSPDAVCTKTAPEIQTTTIPQFPTTGTTDTTKPTDTTTTSTTTTTVVTHITTAPPTTTPSGDVTTTQTAPHHNNGDADGNGFVNMLDCLLVYKVLAGDSQEAVDASQCDYSGDGVFDMLDCLILYNFLAFG